MNRRILLTSILFASGCSNFDKEKSNLNRTQIGADSTGFTILGQAYDTQKVKTLNVPCVNGTVQEKRFTQSNLSLDYDLSYQEFLDKTEGKLSAELNLPVVRAGLGATYAKENAASSSANTFVFNWQMLKRSEVLLPGTYKVSDIGQSFVDADKASLQERCGNEFITQVDYGASFFVTMKVDYLNDTDKSNIGGKLKLGIGEGVDIVKLEGELAKIDEKKKESIKISIQARQVGGDPIKLTEILSENLIECSLSNPKPCFNVFNAAIRYAKTSIPTQLADDSAFAPIRYISENYLESGIDALTPTGGYKNIDALTKAKRFEIETSFQQNLVDYQRASDILRKYSDYLEDPQLEGIAQVKSITNENASVLGDASLVCYETPSSCVSNFKEVEARIKPYDRTKLALRSSMTDLKQGALGTWVFGHPKDPAAFFAKVIGGNKTLEDRSGIALKTNNGELAKIATYISEIDCLKASKLLVSNDSLTIISGKEYGLSFKPEEFGTDFNFTIETAFRSQATNQCLFISFYPTVPLAKSFDLAQPSEIRTFVRRVLESVQ